MANNEFKAIITILDQATAPLRKINQSLGRLNAPFKSIRGAITELGEQSGLHRLGEQARDTMDKFGELGGKITELLGPLAAVGAAASAAGLIEAARASTEYGAHLFDTAKMANVAAESLARLEYAATDEGSSAEELDNALMYLNRTMGDVLSGRNKQLVQVFRAVGISLRDSKGHIKDTAEVFMELSDAVKLNKNNGPLLAELAKAFGSREGSRLLALMENGREGLEELGNEFDRVHGKVTGKFLADAKKSDNAWHQLTSSLDGLRDSVGGILNPALMPLLKRLTDWAAANRTLIGQNVSSWVENIASSLAKIDWKAIADGAMSFFRVIGRVASFLGPMGTGIAAATVVMSPFIAATLSAGASLVRLGFAMGGVAVRLGLLAFGGLIESIVAVIPMVNSLSAAWAAFDLVLDANPIGLIVLGIAALAGSAFLIWKYWKPISAFFQKLWADITSIFESAWKKLKPIVDAVMGAGKWLMEHAASLLGAIPGVGAAVEVGRTAVDVAHRFIVPGQANMQPLGGQSQIGEPLFQRGQSGQTGQRGANGEVHVKVDFNNTPPGTKVTAQSRGEAAPSLDTGVAWALN